MMFRSVRDNKSSRWVESYTSRHGCIAMVLAAVLFACLPGISLGADDNEKATKGEGKKSRYKDPEDGKFDLTAGGDQGAGFFPMAIPFNDPAVGFGLTLAVAYFHPTKGEAPASSGVSQAPPTATFGGVAGTTNSSWFVAGGHHHVWRDDTIRYLGAIGGGSVNLKFYGFGDEGTSEDDGLDFNIEGVGLVQQVKFRIAGSPFSC